MVVSEDHRRSGVGIALLEAFDRFAQGGGASGVDIDVTPGGDKVAIRAFFDHGGYHVSHESRPRCGGWDRSLQTFPRRSTHDH